MTLPAPNLHSDPVREPPAIVQMVTREDVVWNRPVFKAPPLELQFEKFDATVFAEELVRIGLAVKSPA